MQDKHQRLNQLAKLILTTYLCCLPLLACNNQQPVSQEKQTSPPKPQATPTATPNT